MMLISISASAPTREELVACANLFRMSSVKHDVYPDTRPMSKSRKRLCFIKCSRFLELAEKLSRPDEVKMASLRDALNNNIKLSDVPLLGTAERDYLLGYNSIRVIEHEGRHRALALIELGVNYMPVMFSGPRWTEQVDGNKYDRAPSWPRYLVAEDERLTIPFPISRDKADATAFDCVVL